MIEKDKRLTICSNGRYLQSANGHPFFLLADTAWELFHRLTLEEIEFYFDTRKSQGFNVAQCVLISGNYLIQIIIFTRDQVNKI